MAPGRTSPQFVREGAVAAPAPTNPALIRPES